MYFPCRSYQLMSSSQFRFVVLTYTHGMQDADSGHNYGIGKWPSLLGSDPTVNQNVGLGTHSLKHLWFSGMVWRVYSYTLGGLRNTIIIARHFRGATFLLFSWVSNPTLPWEYNDVQRLKAWPGSASGKQLTHEYQRNAFRGQSKISRYTVPSRK